MTGREHCGLSPIHPSSASSSGLETLGRPAPPLGLSVRVCKVEIGLGPVQRLKAPQSMFNCPRGRRTGAGASRRIKTPQPGSRDHQSSLSHPSSQRGNWGLGWGGK